MRLFEYQRFRFLVLLATILLTLPVQFGFNILAFGQDAKPPVLNLSSGDNRSRDFDFNVSDDGIRLLLSDTDVVEIVQSKPRHCRLGDFCRFDIIFNGRRLFELYLGATQPVRAQTGGKLFISRNDDRNLDVRFAMAIQGHFHEEPFSFLLEYKSARNGNAFCSAPDSVPEIQVRKGKMRVGANLVMTPGRNGCIFVLYSAEKNAGEGSK